MSKIYLIGSLRNPRVPEIAAKLRDAGHVVFDDWFAAGPEADDWWQKYEIARGHNFKEGLAGMLHIMFTILTSTISTPMILQC